MRYKFFDLLKYQSLPVARLGDFKLVPLGKLQIWLEQREQLETA